MVNEAVFEDNASQWEMWRKDKAVYKTWMTDKISDKKATRPLARLPLPGPVRGGDQAGSGSRRHRDHRGHPGRERRRHKTSVRGDTAWQSRPRPRPAASDDKELLISGQRSRSPRRSRSPTSTSSRRIRSGPYDTVMQAIAKKIANGQLVAEYIVAEGEHSQFEIVKHASTVGARVFCGSSGVGWMYAMECLAVTPPLRVPMVCHGRQPRARRSGRLRRRAQRRARRARPGLAAHAGSTPRRRRSTPR